MYQRWVNGPYWFSIKCSFYVSKFRVSKKCSRVSFCKINLHSMIRVLDVLILNKSNKFPLSLLPLILASPVTCSFFNQFHALFYIFLVWKLWWLLPCSPTFFFSHHSLLDFLPLTPSSHYPVSCHKPHCYPLFYRGFFFPVGLYPSPFFIIHIFKLQVTSGCS